jgi:hypothetical protein
MRATPAQTKQRRSRIGGERSCDISIASEEAKSHRENRAKQSLGEALFLFFG